MKSQSSSYLTEEGKLTLDEASTLVKEISFMMLTLVKEQAPIPPPCYQRAQAQLRPALHLDALTLVRTLHLLALCHLAVRVAHRRCAPPLSAGPGGAPRTYSEASLLLIGLLRTLWALVVSGYTRLVEKLACVGLGLWFAGGQRWTDPHSQ